MIFSDIAPARGGGYLHHNFVESLKILANQHRHRENQTSATIGIEVRADVKEQRACGVALPILNLAVVFESPTKIHRLVIKDLHKGYDAYSELSLFDLGPG